MAVTAADPNESSYAVYYDSEFQTFLGDVFSVKWMEDSDKVSNRNIYRYKESESNMNIFWFILLNK